MDNFSSSHYLSIPETTIISKNVNYPHRWIPSIHLKYWSKRGHDLLITLVKSQDDICIKRINTHGYLEYQTLFDNLRQTNFDDSVKYFIPAGIQTHRNIK